ncbi:hypothetical protein M501DRAFT_1030978 [Patellaria atrata CBS 101060]|uniref:Uncharacterized protein n=1 Tax=Patellaria atrata CBS 101060 TaxID=1346257 RepID=A0A9P4VSF0_9PEZI|nr:hypothetical protein M501DRAFT_1030978 [Patellaria atrata CBS 101060]
MDQQHQDTTTISSESSVGSTTSPRIHIPSSSYLTVPNNPPRRLRSSSLPPGPHTLHLPTRSTQSQPSTSPTIVGAPFPILLSQPVAHDPPDLFSYSDPTTPIALTEQLLQDTALRRELPFMSVYSTSSVDSDFSNPPARVYKLPSFADMSDRRSISESEKHQLVQSLNSHRVNTLVELRRIEKIFASLGSPDVTGPMTAAWSYYVNSHSLLTELRNLTKNYPFSSECLDEAKRRVYSDPESNKSWNLCWLVLSKLQNDQLIRYYAHYQASQPQMWGGQIPTADGVQRLSDAFYNEWNWAASEMLRHWDVPPCV